MPYIKSTYEYTKLRRNFGKQPLFQNVPAQMLDSINPNKQDQKQYMLRNPVHRAVQATLPQLSHEANTKQLVTHEQGVDHTEGGWPRDIHVFNEDHTARYRRRVMHEENYIHTVLSLAPTMQHYLNQNNAIEIYEPYFDKMANQEPVEKYSVRIANVFRDNHQRPISCVKWTNESNPKIAVAYSYQSLDGDDDAPTACYLWDVTQQTEPINKLIPEVPCWQIACSPIDAALFVCGLKNGTVSVFDIREGNECVLNSSVYSSHQGPVTALLYCHSRTNTEFFTGSPDGQCIWWDCRDLSKPLDKLFMAIKLPAGEHPSFSNSEGVCSLAFDAGLPTKFLCGTESGLVLNVNRMGREHSEKLVSSWDSHIGSVRSVHRSPCTTRMFLTCGDSTVRVWSEEVRTAPIIVTKPYRYQVMDAAWAPLRYSSYMSICAGGYFYYWDFLRKYNEPLSTLQVAKCELTKITPHAEGHSIAIGDTQGSLHLINLSDTMTEPGSRDKVLMFHTYERETRREHILDNRLKEIRLKMKIEEEAAVASTEVPEEPVDEDEILQKAESEYFRIVNEELINLGQLTPSSVNLL